MNQRTSSPNCRGAPKRELRQHSAAACTTPQVWFQPATLAKWVALADAVGRNRRRAGGFDSLLLFRSALGANPQHAMLLSADALIGYAGQRLNEAAMLAKGLSQYPPTH